MNALLCVGFLAVVAVVVRSLGIALVFTPLGLITVSPDSWYHLRRIWWSVQNFPAVLEFDTYLNFPEGGRTVWTPVFDWTLALLASLAVGGESQAAVERFVVWAPPVIGAVSVIVVYAIGARHFSRAVGFAGAAILAVLPANVWFSRLSFVDHHVAVALASLLLLGAAMEFVKGEKPRLGAAVRLGFGMAGVLLIWAGSLLHVSIAEIFLLGFVLACPESALAVRWARSVAVANGVAAIVVAPLSLGNHWEVYGSFDPAVLSNFQPLFFAAAAATWTAIALLWVQTPAGNTRTTRAIGGVGLGVAGIGLALLVPEMREPVGDAFAWFLQPKEFQQHVNELRPLFYPQGTFNPNRAELLYSRLVYAFPFILVAMLSAARRSSNPGSVVLLVWWGAVMAVLALLQRRFNNSLSPVYAFILGWAVVEGFRRARSHLAGRPLAMAAAAFLAIAVSVPLLSPPTRFYRIESMGLGAFLRGERVAPRGPAAVWARVMLVGRWIRENTPVTAGYLDSAGKPEYGVLANWGDGHMLRYVSERPMVQDNFLGHVGKGGQARFELAGDYFDAVDEQSAIAILDELGARYVVTSQYGSGQSDEFRSESAFAALHVRIGSARGGYPAFRHHRLVYQLYSGGGFQVFERVAGARIEGRARPRARVEARLTLRTRLGKYPYLQRTRANAEGFYELVLPYANDARAGDVEVSADWKIVSGGSRVRLRIDEDQVLNGMRLEGPDFSGP